MGQSAQIVLQEMCARYSGAVNASDAEAYSRLFDDDAIWMPPGAPSRVGPMAIKKAEGADYEKERWSVRFTPGDVLPISEDWIYGIAHVEGAATGLAGGETRTFKLTVTWLLFRQPDNTWKIKRQMWNHKPAEGSDALVP